MRIEITSIDFIGYLIDEGGLQVEPGDADSFLWVVRYSKVGQGSSFAKGCCRYHRGVGVLCVTVAREGGKQRPCNRGSREPCTASEFSIKCIPGGLIFPIFHSSLFF